MGLKPFYGQQTSPWVQMRLLITTSKTISKMAVPSEKGSTVQGKNLLPVKGQMFTYLTSTENVLFHLNVQMYKCVREIYVILLIVFL